MLSKEPVVVVNAVVALVGAVLVFLVNAGVIQLTTEQQDQFNQLIVLVGTIIATFITRSLVTPAK